MISYVRLYWNVKPQTRILLAYKTKHNALYAGGYWSFQQENTGMRMDSLLEA